MTEEQKQQNIERQVMEAELNIVENQFMQTLEKCTVDDLPALEKLEKELGKLEAPLRQLANLVKNVN